MRFFTLFSACSLLATAIAGQLPTRTNTFHLDKRQLPIGPVDLTLCATVNADVDIAARLPLQQLTAATLLLLGLDLTDIGQDSDINLTEK